MGESYPGTSSHLPERIALIGFMGSGKSTVGRLLARALGYRFLDLDALIERRAGRPIRRIFAEEGEESFRRLETEVLLSQAGRRRVVIAAGGGAPMRPENQSFLRSACTTFYLEVSFAEFLRRTGTDPRRPLLQRSREELRALYHRRAPVYATLGRRLNTDGSSPQRLAGRIAALLDPAADHLPPGEGEE